MRYYDKVYGHFEITEPVILELLKLPALKRLKDIDAGGFGPLLARPYPFGSKLTHNHFIHSIGVNYLLNKYNACPEEQIAGLIHDISHSAFSHVIDHVLPAGNSKKQNLQDAIFKNFIKKTGIPKIIKKHGFDLKYILNDKNFPLKENKLPDLCADRIDYSLRWAIIFKEISPAGAKKILNNLRAENVNWFFEDYNSAKRYAELFYKLNKKYFAGTHSAVMFATVGDCLKYALSKKYIIPADLYTTDTEVINKIKKHLKQDQRLSLLWLRMNPVKSDQVGAKLFNGVNGKIKVRQSRKNYDAHIFCKSRIVDPLFMRHGKIMRLSQALPGWKKIVKQELKPKEYFLKFDA